MTKVAERIQKVNLANDLPGLFINNEKYFQRSIDLEIIFLQYQLVPENNILKISFYMSKFPYILVRRSMTDHCETL